MWGSDLFQEVYSVIEQWNPAQKYSSEKGYRDDLIRFLRKDFDTQRPFDFNRSPHKILKEDGRGLADIGIDNKIGIELKLNLNTKSEVDRLTGQVEGFLDGGYSGVIVVLCGKTSEEKVEELKPRLRKRKETNMFSEGKQIALIVKQARSNTKGKSSLFDIGPF